MGDQFDFWYSTRALCASTYFATSLSEQPEFTVSNAFESSLVVPLSGRSLAGEHASIHIYNSRKLWDHCTPSHLHHTINIQENTAQL